jgi:hypothetical protein
MTRAIELCDQPRGYPVPVGAAGGKAMAIVLGEGDANAQSGNEYA